MISEEIKKARERFDEAAASWDDSPGRLQTARRVSEAIERLFPMEQAGDLLDYGCATGLVSYKYIPLVKSFTGMDTSKVMLERFAERASLIEGANQSRFVHLEPEKDLLPETEDGSLDTIISTMTFHHIPDIEQVLSRFLRALRPGGRVIVVDLDTEDGSFHVKGNEGVVHLGFERETIQQALEATGFRKITIDTAFIHTREGAPRDYPFFIALGERVG